MTNIAATVDKLKQQGVWVCGTAADGATALYDADLTGPTAIVIGNEGHGISRLVAEPILLYEAVRQRSSGAANQ